ncbi:putative lipase [Aspergillus ibericus CBS 121593]|uniref:sn-1-specific diacylglycerol lipase n=1 Tax=Aspergillus ibericus CBS 121593 TaxID=1448316 RepID=A0A395GML6_9EURO|nr:putative lipase [Aspergillus ibericus CBS 121593]RAK96745.1 putative lipase [Aspergillus ibericus CBS 121593]
MSRLFGLGRARKRDVAKQSRIDTVHDDDACHVPATSGLPLLPRPLASMVSFMTQSTSLSLRLGTFVGGLALDGAKATTLTGLELSRAVIEGILTRAGRDVAIRTHGEHGKAEAESLLERSLATLHKTVTSASFFAAASFHFSSTTLSSAANMSQSLLSTLDAILGSTESSRAIAAIITLIRREFRSPNADTGADKIGVGDLLVGCVGFALLQRWGRRNTQIHLRANNGEETVWDVVILDSGLRADVVGSHQLDMAAISHDSSRDKTNCSSFISPGNDEEIFDAVQRPASTVDPSEYPSITLPPNEQHPVSDEDIRLYIMKQLPQGCHASIRTDLVTTRTITLDIYDGDTAEISPPPGTMMIEENFNDELGHRHSSGSQLPRHTVVFRTAFNKSQSLDVRPSQKQDTAVYQVGTGTGDPSSHHALGEAENEAINGRQAPQSKLAVQGHLEADPHMRTTRMATPGKQDRGDSSQQPLNEAGTAPRSSYIKAKSTQKGKPGSSDKKDAGRSTGSSENPRTPASSENQPHQGKSKKGSNPTKKPDNLSISHNRKSLTSVANRGLPRTPLQGPRIRSAPIPTTRQFESRDTNHGQTPRTERYTVHEKNNERYVAQTDAYTRPSLDVRPGTPTSRRAHVRSSSSMSLTRSESDVTISINDESRPSSPVFYRQSGSFSPSLYSLATAGSETSLILAHRGRSSAYDEIETIQALNRDGTVPGIFPEKHFVHNIRRFCRFSSASYGSNALKVMGIPRTIQGLPYQESHSPQHSEFSDHAGLPASTILLSSYVDPAGGTNAAGETESGFPLVHYLFLDHESKAVVLTLRGTWGFEDILTDMTCDYDDLEWQGRSWKVHKGMHASAKRLLMGGGSRVMITIRAALEDFPDYGVVFCGHSLGGGVAALLATMISEPNNNESSGTSFTTASYQSAKGNLPLAGSNEGDSAFFLPPGRPIHVYAYGPPSTMSPFLRRATRGLITAVVNGQDVVPSLSLGILHDMHTASLAFKSDVSNAKSHVRFRVWEGLRQSIVNKFYVNEPPILTHAGDGVGEDAWAWNTLKMLRDEMHAPKLMPPGEVFVVETMRVLQRNAFTSDLDKDGYPLLGRPATRVQLKFIRDVESLFGELRFGSGMFSDHNPARYEASLAALARGILDS